MDTGEDVRAALRALGHWPAPEADALALAAWLESSADDAQCAAVEAALAADPELAVAMLVAREAQPETVPEAELARARALRPRPRWWRVHAWVPARAALALASLAAVAVLGHALGSELGRVEARRELAMLERFAFGEDPWLEDAR